MRVDSMAVQWEYLASHPEKKHFAEETWAAFSPENSRLAEEQLAAGSKQFTLQVWDRPTKAVDVDTEAMTQWCEHTKTSRKIRRVIVLAQPE